MVVLRDGKEITLKGKVGTPIAEVEVIVPVEGATSEQVRLREIWMKG